MATITITLPIEPGRLAINRKSALRYGKGNKKVIGNSDGYTAAVDEATLHVRQAVVRERWRTRGMPVHVLIHAYWPSARGDLDAVAKGVLDSLQHGLAVTDDKLVSECLLRRSWSCSRPRIEVTVTDEEE